MTWTAHIFDVPEQRNGWYGFRYETLQGKDGMHTVVGKLFGEDGSLIAWTEQLVAVFS
ncbi:MAG: thioesterase family protein [Kofleriaceae bacterium]|nr:thioesterase family protein [Kofleriaceae bacterium]